MKVVLSLGGSVLGDIDRIKRFAEVLEDCSKDKTLFVVVGGGKLAREIIEKARKLGANETLCDYLGIEVTRINALLLASAIRSAPKRVPKDFKEADELSRIYPIVVMGGTFPGHTTDATAALLAEYVGADLFLNATSVDGVYSADPKLDKNAVKYDKLSPSQLVQIVSREAMKAGANVVIDLLAAKIIERSKIKTLVFLGDPENVRKVLNGELLGTVIE